MCGMQMEEEEIPFAQLEEEADDLANLMQSMHQCLDEEDDGGGGQQDATCIIIREFLSSFRKNLMS